RNIHFLAAAIDRDAHLVSRALLVQYEIHVKLRSNFLTVDCDDHVAAHVKPAHADCRDVVAAMYSNLRCRPAARNGLHEQAFLNGKIQYFSKSAANDERIHPEISLVNSTIRDQIVSNPLCRVDRNCKADTSCCSRRGVDRGVDADDFTI